MPTKAIQANKNKINMTWWYIDTYPVTQWCYQLYLQQHTKGNQKEYQNTCTFIQILDT